MRDKVHWRCIILVFVVFVSLLLPRGTEQLEQLEAYCSLISNLECGKARTISFELPPMGTLAGGFGDRLLGIVTTWYLALLTDSCFKIKWTRPYNIRDFFEIRACHPLALTTDLKDRQYTRTMITNKINHDVNRHVHLDDLERQEYTQILEKKSPKTGIHLRTTSKPILHDFLSEPSWNYFSSVQMVDPKEIISDVIFWTNARNWDDVVHHKQLLQKAFILGLSDKSKQDLFKIAIETLLNQPKPVLAMAYEKLLRRFDQSIDQLLGKSKSRPYFHESTPNIREVVRFPIVGVQIRTGGNGEYWDDPARQPLSRTACFAVETARLCQYRPLCSVFVTADHPDAPELFENELKSHLEDISPETRVLILQNPGKIVHTDRSNTMERNESSLWLKQVLDWWTLRHASELVISRSGFGETAAWSSNATIVRRLLLNEGNDSCTFDDGVLDLSRFLKGGE